MFCVYKEEFVIAKDAEGGGLVVFGPRGRKGHCQSVVPDFRFCDAIEVRAGGKPRDTGQREGTVSWGLHHAFLFEDPGPVSETWIVVRPEGSFCGRIE
jgi:hypothetical protein